MHVIYEMDFCKQMYLYLFFQNELITYKGYPSEEYEVMTEDGYIITINRIPYGTQNQGNSGTVL